MNSYCTYATLQSALWQNKRDEQQQPPGPFRTREELELEWKSNRLKPHRAKRIKTRYALVHP